jgi:phosphohistidine phosphatase
MNLYFLRHGKAEDRQPGLSDFDRRLTSEGVAEMRQEGAGLAALKLRVDLILSSPLPRALETAQIVAEEFNLPKERLIEDGRLAAGVFALGNLQSLLEDHAQYDNVMLVGHEPDLSSLVHTLCGAVIDMKKGGLACVDTARVEPGLGVLRWLLTPRHLLLHASG